MDSQAAAKRCVGPSDSGSSFPASQKTEQATQQHGLRRGEGLFAALVERDREGVLEEALREMDERTPCLLLVERNAEASPKEVIKRLNSVFIMDVSVAFSFRYL